MRTQQIDNFARRIAPSVRESVHSNTAAGTEKRDLVLHRDYADPDALRRLAGQIKQHTIENLDTYLPQAEAKLRENGVGVHYASGRDSARSIILGLLRKAGATRVAKAKSMASEEIELNDFLQKEGVECVETDLGEFILQLDGDHPSHVVKPIIHKNRREIATTFEKHGLGAYNDDPATITHRARLFMRDKYLHSDAAITGGNFISVESGRLVLVTNEGNSRFSLAGSKIHIALVGIEKLVPRDRDLAVMLNLLARSATGQQLTVYTEFISGPKLENQAEGPREMHVVFLDNHRSEVLASDCREILRCIRCGACMNVCPVYRQASGHAYRSVYPGPLGAVLSPLLAGKRFPELADLPKASSLCGACNEVCPVDIPIPDLLLRLRNRAKNEKLPSPGTPPMGPWAVLASQPAIWKTSLKAGVAMNYLPLAEIPVPPLSDWTRTRTLPEWRGGEFRSWMKKRQAKKASAAENQTKNGEANHG